MEERRRWDAVFSQYDVHHQNFITVETFKRLLHEGGLREEIDGRRIKQLLDFADRNRDGYLTRTEFLDFMMGEITTDDDFSPEENRRTGGGREVESDRKRAVNKIRRMAMKESLGSEDRISDYTTVMSEDGFYPAFIPLVSIVQLAVFIWYCVDMKEISLSGPVPIHSIFIFDPEKHVQLWRFITYMFVHAGIEHIAANLLFQLLIGILLEIVHGPLRMMVIYFAGVLAGSLATAVIDPNVFLCGGSAGVYALLAAYFANIIMNWSEMSWIFRLIRLIGLAIYAGLDFGMAIYRRYGTKEESQVAYMAHVAGALAGFLVGVVILRNIKKKLHEQILFWICLVIYVILIVLLLIAYIAIEFRTDD